jgi:AraC-like DNA-binding protein
MMSGLVEAVTRFTNRQSGDSPYYTEIDGLIVLRSQTERHPTHIIHKPALCIVVQGAKWTTFGDRRLHYRAGQAMVVSLEMPGFSQVVEGGPDAPYLSVVIELDASAVRDVMAALDSPPTGDDRRALGAFVVDFDGPLVECAMRAVRLLDTPKAAPILYPGLMREICYWLLTGPHGGAIARVIVGTKRGARLVDAVQTLRTRFAKTVRIEDLASTAGLSPSAFHRQFKTLTSMTPLQYQKKIRLMEARRLMITGAATAETAAFKVGYESPSQFSREYARTFRVPPKRDIERLRQAASHPRDSRMATSRTAG